MAFLVLPRPSRNGQKDETQLQHGFLLSLLLLRTFRAQQYGYASITQLSKMEERSSDDIDYLLEANSAHRPLAYVSRQLVRIAEREKCARA
jgi:hypothetical protein